MGGGYSGNASSRIGLPARRPRAETKLGAILTLRTTAFSTIVLANPDTVRGGGLTKQIHSQNQGLPAARIAGARARTGFPHRREEQFHDGLFQARIHLTEPPDPCLLGRCQAGDGAGGYELDERAIQLGLGLRREVNFIR